MSSALGLAAVPALIALGYVMAVVTGTSIIHILLPFLVPLMPLSVGYALIRHNVFETSAVLSAADVRGAGADRRDGRGDHRVARAARGRTQ